MKKENELNSELNINPTPKVRKLLKKKKGSNNFNYMEEISLKYQVSYDKEETHLKCGKPVKGNLLIDIKFIEFRS